MTDLVNSHVKILKEEAEKDPNCFWTREAKKIHWFKKWDSIFDWDLQNFRWFRNGLTNLSYNCLDLNVQRGWASHAALVSESEKGDRRVLTYSQLWSEVKKVAAALRGLGVARGDRVAIYMPTISEAIIAMLAVTRIGAIHIVVFAGFGSGALADRINLSGAKVLLTADVTWRKGKELSLWDITRNALQLTSSIQKVVILGRRNQNQLLTEEQVIEWNDFLDQGRGYSDGFEKMESNEPAYILATSGTTGKPKLAVHNHGGYQVWLRSTAEWLFALRSTDVWWSTSDIGWVVGHGHIVYAPLLFGCTTIAYEGALDYPGPENLYRITEEYGVTGIFTAPTAVRLLMKYGTEPARRFDLSSVERVFSAGEVLNPVALKWLRQEVFQNRIPVIDHWWQTETGGPVVGNPFGVGLLPIKPGSATIPLPGVSLQIKTIDGATCASGETGLVVITKPFPGLIQTLWEDPERYKLDYWQRVNGAYFTGDLASIDEDGYVWFKGRADDVIKVAAHRLGTIEVENALLTHESVAEAGVTGRPDELRGEVISAFVVLKQGCQPSERLRSELFETVRRELGALAVVGEINFMSSLPKTRSGKIMRRVLKSVVLNRDPGDISTIEDEGTVEEARMLWAQMKDELVKSSSTIGEEES